MENMLPVPPYQVFGTERGGGPLVNRETAIDVDMSRDMRFTKMVCATSKASDQPAHTCSLSRAFASRLNIL